MKLIVGGVGAGKLDYILQTRGFSREEVAESFVEAKGKPVLNGLQNCVRRALEAGEDPLQLTEALLSENPELVILCDEVGCGVVPLEPAERQYREAVGRLCCTLAARAGRVERLICGIPTVLKEEEPWS